MNVAFIFWQKCHLHLTHIAHLQHICFLNFILDSQCCFMCFKHLESWHKKKEQGRLKTLRLFLSDVSLFYSWSQMNLSFLHENPSCESFVVSVYHLTHPFFWPKMCPMVLVGHTIMKRFPLKILRFEGNEDEILCKDQMQIMKVINYEPRDQRGGSWMQ